MANRQSSGAIDDSEYPKIKVSDTEQVDHTGTTDPTVVKTYTIPAGLLGINGVLKYRVRGYTTGNNDEKIIQLELDGDGVCEVTSPADMVEAQFLVTGVIANKQAENAQVVMSFNVANEVGAHCGDVIDLTVDTSAAVVLEVIVTLRHADDNCLIKHFEIEVIPND